MNKSFEASSGGKLAPLVSLDSNPEEFSAEIVQPDLFSQELVKQVIEQRINSPLTGRILWFHPVSFMRRPMGQRVIGFTKKYIITAGKNKSEQSLLDRELWFWCRYTGACINFSTRFKLPDDQIQFINSIIGPPDINALSIEPGGI